MTRGVHPPLVRGPRCKSLHVHGLRDLGAARLQDRAALRFLVRIGKARGFDEAVATDWIGTAAVDQRTVLLDRAGLADRIAAVDDSGTQSSKPGAPGVHHLLHLVRMGGV